MILATHPVFDNCEVLVIGTLGTGRYGKGDLCFENQFGAPKQWVRVLFWSDDDRIVPEGTEFLCRKKISSADFWVSGMVFAIIKNPSSFGHSTGDWNKILSTYPGFKAWSERFVLANSKRMETREGDYTF